MFKSVQNAKFYVVYWSVCVCNLKFGVIGRKILRQEPQIWHQQRQHSRLGRQISRQQRQRWRFEAIYFKKHYRFSINLTVFLLKNKLNLNIKQTFT